MIVGLILLLAIGAPIAYAITALLLMLMTTGEFPYHVRIVAQQFFGGLNSYPLLAIPLFILAGDVMNASGITDRIVRLANSFVGHLGAGLAHVNIWASVIFAGLSGSAVADTSALGRIFIPSMEKQGYPREFAAALTAASSVIGPIIPPSIPVIIYALIVTGVSVPGLFLGGIVPGLLLAVGLSIYVILFAQKYEKRSARRSWNERFLALKDGVVPLLMPVFVVGTILGGIVTPTEAATLAVAYALVVGLFVFRTLSWMDLPGLFSKAMRDSAAIMVIIGAISAANWVMTFNRVPNLISAFVLRQVESPTIFLLT
ncbi:MAG: TRAP transporter large permease, partial [Deltaproteobacteria bacterium]|nr:TRAP transporter large permease [Deltaproteobacteria bacterium]